MIFEFTTCKDILCWELSRRTRGNPRYSIRAFANHLDLGPGELSEILRGKRRVSVKAALKIAERLGLNEEEKLHLLKLAQTEKLQGEGITLPAPATDTPDGHKPLSSEMFGLISDWYCLAILNLQETRGFRWDEKWIAKRMGISIPQVRIAIERLVRVGMVEKKGLKYEIAKDYHIDPRGIPSEAVRSFHRQMLNKASEALEVQPIDRRDISGLTLAIDPDSLPAMKKELGNFLRSFNSRYGKGRRLTEVYHLELAFFQLTQEEKGK